MPRQPPRRPALIGRAAELARLGALLEDAAAGRPGVVILAGEGGVGKTRLVEATAERAQKKGFEVAIGRAYDAERGIPYALFADAFMPLLGHIEPAQLNLLTRGATAELASIFPALGPGGDRTVSGADPAEVKARALWSFSQLVARLASKQPLLVALENLQWADASSLELLHFVARQLGSGRVAIIATYNEADAGSNPLLKTTEQSLVRGGSATVIRLAQFGPAEVAAMVHETFGSDAQATGAFTALLYGWTRGNPFFVEETLKALVASGKLRQRDGRWYGWEVDQLELPGTIRDALIARVERLGEAARGVTALAAVIGTRVSYDSLRTVADLPDSGLVAAIEELCSGRILEERPSDGSVVYDFVHPFLQQVVYASLTEARARLLHAAVAEALETRYGSGAESHADELAFHYARSHAHALAPKAVKYLAAAGRRALERHANREAAEYLSAALTHETAASGSDSRAELLRSLARARQRLGDYDAALTLWEEALAAADDPGAAAAIRYRMGLACYWSGRYDDALEFFEAALADKRALEGGRGAALRVRLHLARGICLQDIGRFGEAEAGVHAALAVAEEIGEPALLARVHRALLLMHAWAGAAALAREHGEKTIELARKAGDKTLLWSGHWGMAMLSGLTGDAKGVTRHVELAGEIADELGSPLLPLWTDELTIQYAASVGDWDRGLTVGETAIARARALSQRMLLPRLLVWTGLIHLGRGDRERAKEMFDEAWGVSGAGRGRERALDIPTIVPAHLGLASYHMALAEYHEAVRLGERGLELADRAGHSVWAVQWLLPLVAEARMWSGDFVGARAHGKRLREESERLDHRLGRAGALACEGLILLLSDRDSARAAVVLREAAERLEEIPYPYTAARIRRELARALKEAGDRAGALRELKRAHDLFARLGARRELEHARGQLRALGARPPTAHVGAGAAGLTGRELEIARMVASRKANKEIGAALKISSRTVSTHLSNVFTKLGVESRGELADYVRDRGLLDD